MSVYNSGSRTQILDPVIDVANNRVEWRLNPNSCYSSNMRILNLGLTASADTSYNRLAGVYGMIKNIYLMDGNGTTLDQLLDANKFLGFKAFNRGHNDSNSKSAMNIGNFLGEVLRTDNKVGKLIVQKQVKQTTATTTKGMLVLSDALPMLKRTEILPTTIFKELRLVMEFETDKNALGHNNTLTYTTLPNPLLVVEEILDSSVVSALTKSFNGIGWLSIERDMISHSTKLAVTGTREQSNSASLLYKAFDNKYLHRVLLLTQPTSANSLALAAGGVAGGGSLYSGALVKPQYQFVVNGRNKLTGLGLEKSSEIQDKLVQTWGENSTGLGGDKLGVFFDTNYTGEPLNTPAKQSYVGLSIEEFIRDFSLSLNFTAQFNQTAGTPADVGYDQFNSPLNMVIFGECRKSIVVAKDGSYVVSYN